jgi:hypothetical protein
MTFRRQRTDGFEWRVDILSLSPPVPQLPITLTIWATPESRTAAAPPAHVLPAAATRRWPLLVRILAKLVGRAFPLIEQQSKKFNERAQG